MKKTRWILRWRSRLPSLPLWFKSFGLFLAASTVPLIIAGAVVLRIRAGEAETHTFQVLLLRLRLVEQEIATRLTEKGWRPGACADGKPSIERRTTGGREEFTLVRGTCPPLDLGTVDDFVRLFRALEAEDTIVLFDAAGRPLVSNMIESGYNVPAEAEEKLRPRGEYFNSLHPVWIGGVKYLALHLPVHTLGVHAVALRPYEVVMAGVRHTTRVQLWILAAAGAVSLLVGILAVTWHVRPLRQIEQFVEAVVRGDFSVVPRARGRDERREIFHRLNRLRLRLRRERAFIRETSLEENRTAQEAVVRRKKDFIAHLSHEIRTPLAMIMGIAETLASRPMEDQDRELLERARESSQGALDLLNSLLNASRLETIGKSRAGVFRLTDVLHHIESLFRDAALRRGLRLEMDAAAELPQLVSGDRNHLRQILTNLLGNALKYTRQGSVTLRVRVLERSARNIRLRFDVMDTGPGIDPALKELIFARYATLEDRPDATGLGLAITRELVAHMGGELTLTSVPGEGSVFSVDLPFDIPLSEAPPLSVTPDTKQRKILVVEDLDVLRSIYRAFLRAEPVSADFASTAGEALTLAARTAYDVILLDVELPDFHGSEVARRVRGLEKSENRNPAWIVACTAHSGEEAESMMEAGCNRSLLKPFSREDLYRIMEPDSRTT